MLFGLPLAFATLFTDKVVRSQCRGSPALLLREVFPVVRPHL